MLTDDETLFGLLVGRRQRHHRSPEPLGGQRLGSELHRLAPAEPGQEDQDGSQRVEVPYRVGGEAAHGAGEPVALKVGDQRVGVFVEPDGTHQRDGQEEERDGILTQQGEQADVHGRVL